MIKLMYLLETISNTVIVYNGHILNTGLKTGAGVGSTLGSGIYVTSNKDDTSRLAAIDYAGGKFTKNKPGEIITYKLNLNGNYLYTGEIYLLDELLQLPLSKWFIDRISSWKNNGWYKNGIKGGTLIRLIQSPSSHHEKPMDFGKVGFDGAITLFDDNSIYEAAITNHLMLTEIKREKT